MFLTLLPEFVGVKAYPGHTINCNCLGAFGEEMVLDRLYLCVAA